MDLLQQLKRQHDIEYNKSMLPKFYDTPAENIKVEDTLEEIREKCEAFIAHHQTDFTYFKSDFEDTYFNQIDERKMEWDQMRTIKAFKN